MLRDVDPDLKHTNSKISLITEIKEKGSKFSVSTLMSDDCPLTEELLLLSVFRTKVTKKYKSAQVLAYRLGE